ncbi:MAG: tyrosine-protein phosphatase [Deltaproteobacteria bacterium]|nr:tyrosine-protein phosphatase [Deltaproteobacteria bacterium]MBW2417977.1 tyrosine-protein phosphatase [Deltaproteobacteria bacterium]
MPPFREPPTQRFERVANFRDLGGHTTREGRRVPSGRLFRSGHLGHASDDDVEQLASLGLRRVFDFRTLADIEHDGPDRLPPSVEHLRLPMPDPAGGQDLRSLIQESGPDVIQEMFGNGRAAEWMRRSAAGLVRERREPYAEFLTELARPGSVPALFHCSAGKDRAGWAGSLVLLTLGVEEEQVVEQYLLSNRETERIRERLRSAAVADAEKFSDLLEPLLAVHPDYIDASFRAMHEDWGDFDRYLHEGLGISEEQRGQLQASLLE